MKKEGRRALRDAEIAARVTSTIKVHLIGDAINPVVEHRRFCVFVIYSRISRFSKILYTFDVSSIKFILKNSVIEYISSNF
jgi:hypothetical protein